MLSELNTAILIGFALAILGSGAFLGAMFGINKAIKSGKKEEVGQAITVAKTVVDGAQALNTTIGKALLPSSIGSMIDKILQVSEAAVKRSEQLYLNSEIPKDLRKDEALDFALNLLRIDGREVTPELEEAIKGAIESAVFVMKRTVGPTHVTVEETVTSS